MKSVFKAHKCCKGFINRERWPRRRSVTTWSQFVLSGFRKTHASACCGAAVITVDGNKRKRLPAMVALLHSRWGGGGCTLDRDCRLQGSAGCRMHGSCRVLCWCVRKMWISCLKSCGCEQTGSPGVGQNLQGSGSHPAVQSVQCLFCPQHNRVDVLRLWELVQCVLSYCLS